MLCVIGVQINFACDIPGKGDIRLSHVGFGLLFQEDSLVGAGSVCVQEA